MKGFVVGVLSLCGFSSWAAAQTALTYQKPPAAIEELLDAPLTPVVKPSPDHSLLLVQQPQSRGCRRCSRRAIWHGRRIRSMSPLSSGKPMVCSCGWSMWRRHQRIEWDPSN